MKHIFWLTGLMITLGCSSGGDSDIDARLEQLTGHAFLAMSDAEKQTLVADSLARFTTWRFWARPDLCAAVLNQRSIMSLYEASAEKAQENPMMFYFAVQANETCVKQDQPIK